MFLSISCLVISMTLSNAKSEVSLPPYWWLPGNERAFINLANDLDLDFPGELHRFDPARPAKRDDGNRVGMLSEELMEKHRCYCMPASTCPAGKLSTVQSSEQCPAGQTCCTVNPGYQPGCGKLPPSSEPTQGVESISVPWVVSLLLPTNGGYMLLCSGTLVHPQVVLTAARCLSSLGEEGRNILVRAGDRDLMNNTEAEEFQEIPVQRVEFHPNYSQLEKHNDLALLFLARPFKIREGVEEICVRHLSEGSRSSGQCMSAAHGIRDANASQSQSNSLELRQVTQTLIPHGDCQERLRRYPKYPTFKLHDSFVCAASSACDLMTDRAGSPLTCVDPLSGRHQLVGITSWGVGCSGQGKPGVFTNIDMFYIWLSSRVTDYFGYIESYFGFNQE